MTTEIKITPMMQQFLDIKNQHPDCVLLFRAGDFYETFYDDAKECSQILNITLTQRGGVPMAGVPFHSINPYIKKLLEHNKKVAIVEQLEDPKQAKGLVKRGVKQILTPGTLIEDEFMQEVQSSYLCTISLPNNKQEQYGVILIEVSTGDCIAKMCENFSQIKNMIQAYSPSEILTSDHPMKRIVLQYAEQQNIYLSTISMQRFHQLYAQEIIKKHFKKNLSNQLLNELNNSPKLIEALGASLYYIKALKHQELHHIDSISILQEQTHTVLEDVTLKNLDVIKCAYSTDKNKTLLGSIDYTKTPMGKRELKKRIIASLTNKEEIEKRFEKIEIITNQYPHFIHDLQEELKHIFDIERIITRIQSQTSTPRDIDTLKQSIYHILSLIDLTNSIPELNLFKKENISKEIMEIFNFLNSAIIDQAPAHTRDFGYIKEGFSNERDETFQISQNSTQFLIELEKKLKEITQITTLKVKYNKIFGYYIDVPKAQENKVTQDFILKQTLVNTNRYITPELKEKEQLILGAKEKLILLEQELFSEIIIKLQENIQILKYSIQELKELDITLSACYMIQYKQYSIPKFSNTITKVIGGRNPIVERFVTNFIENDYEFNQDDSCKIITGPNMAGKSTFLRQVALISLIAQIGYPIPAKDATLKIYDSIFTRIGAHDELSQNQSTFMVEMSESAHILNTATKDSLTIFDEIGRGTSTYDGMAIAQAIVEEMSNKESHTLFATHYHELNVLENTFENICNYHVEVEEQNEEITFLHKIKKGGTNNSYGIHVAKLANVPQSVLLRSQEILNQLEKKN